MRWLLLLGFVAFLGLSLFLRGSFDSTLLFGATVEPWRLEEAAQQQLDYSRALGDKEGAQAAARAANAATLRMVLNLAGWLCLGLYLFGFKRKRAASKAVSENADGA